MQVLPDDERPSLEDLMEHVALKIVPIYKQAKQASPSSTKKPKERLQMIAVIKEITRYIKEKPLTEVLIKVKKDVFENSKTHVNILIFPTSLSCLHQAYL